MHASFFELSKYLKLEINKGFNNKAIVGGIESMLPIWKERALQAGIDECVALQITALFDDYAAGDLTTRKRIIRSALDIINNQKPELEEIQPSTPRSNTSGSSYQPRAVFAPLTVIQGIGEKNAQKMEKLNLHSIYDLLHFYPRRYNDYSHLTPIRDLKPGDEVTISGAVQSIQKRKTRNNRMQIIESIIGDGTGSLWITWFNQPWLTNRLNIGTQIVASGKVDTYLGRLCLNNPEWEPIDVDHLHTNRIVPVYPLTAGIQQKWLRERIYQAINYWTEKIKDYLPNSILETEQLYSLNQALQAIHFPASQQELGKARERLSFDELLFMQLGVIRQKREWQSNAAVSYQINQETLEKEIQNLPFKLTISQQKTLLEIQADLQSGKQMNRLLQGDVGSGKTIIARFAMETVMRCGKQAAFLAPTAILAQQHFDTLRTMLLHDQVIDENEIALLIGDTPEKQKEQIKQDLASGIIKIIIGTHALLEGPITFQSLQMVVIDEQHRFGVAQRAALRSKGENPHILIMSATPIPRSLNLTIYGDLDISALTDMPGGRIPVKTYLLHSRQKAIAYEKIALQIEAGHQAFIIYPQIEGDDQEAFTPAVIPGYEELVGKIFPQYKIGLLHGRLKQEEKDTILQKFRSKKLDILASTTVIEVGMDIPNATIILIEGANRFGLAQLHQLRGRVGRGNVESFCYLVPEEDMNFENDRLRKMTETNDGFELAEFDLKTRGPGDFFGTRQSGYRGLKLANISDIKLITRARNQAQTLIDRDPDLISDENSALRFELENLWNINNGELS
ncbi:MAG: ATP-dependent DNA helicase RecG [Anaerolineaceae bacterium]